MTHLKHLAALGCILAAPVFAAGSSSDTPPTPTETTKVCEDGMVWDEKTEECVAVQDSRLNDETLYEAVREFAYLGRLDDATGALDAMEDQTDSRVLTYRGFVARKGGDMDAAMAFYAAALEADPRNHLARSYMGQGLAEAGRYDLARAELSTIRANGGRGTWAEISLRMAIDTGRGSSY